MSIDDVLRWCGLPENCDLPDRQRLTVEQARTLWQRHGGHHCPARDVAVEVLIIEGVLQPDERLARALS